MEPKKSYMNGTCMDHICYNSKFNPGQYVIATRESEEGLFKIQELVQQEAPSIMIEIGTNVGGVTLALHEALPNVHLYSYDILSYIKHPCGLFNYDFVHFKIEDVYPKRSHNKSIASNITSSPGKVFIYCDGGEKDTEVNLYAPLLKVGDIVGFHDYGTCLTLENIKDTIINFEPMPINDWMEQNNHSDRFFRRTK
jgi:hypothetical protein